MSANHPISEDELRRAYQIAALLVVQFGDEFLPHFEVLEREVSMLKVRQSVRDRALAVAQSNP